MFENIVAEMNNPVAIASASMAIVSGFVGAELSRGRDGMITWMAQKWERRAWHDCPNCGCKKSLSPTHQNFLTFAQFMTGKFNFPSDAFRVALFKADKKQRGECLDNVDWNLRATGLPGDDLTGQITSCLNCKASFLDVHKNKAFASVEELFGFPEPSVRSRPAV